VPIVLKSGGLKLLEPSEPVQDSTGSALLYIFWVQVPVAARSKAWAYGRSLAAIPGLNLARGVDVCLL